MLKPAKITFATRGRAVAARRAHNPEVAGSSPAPATNIRKSQVGFFYFKSLFDILMSYARIMKK